MDMLPMEIVTEILQHLDQKSLKKLRLSCKSHCSLANTCLFKTVIVRNPTFYGYLRSLNNLRSMSNDENLSNHVRIIYVEEISPFNRQLEPCLQKLPNLRKMILKRWFYQCCWDDEIKKSGKRVFRIIRQLSERGIRQGVNLGLNITLNARRIEQYPQSISMYMQSAFSSLTELRLSAPGTIDTFAKGPPPIVDNFNDIVPIFLEHTCRLSKLELCPLNPSSPRGCSYFLYRDCQLGLSRALSKRQYWPLLKQLRLDGVRTDGATLFRVLSSHSAHLLHLSLSDIIFTSNDSPEATKIGWPELVSYLHHNLRLQSLEVRFELIEDFPGGIYWEAPNDNDVFNGRLWVPQTNSRGHADIELYRRLCAAQKISTSLFATTVDFVLHHNSMNPFPERVILLNDPVSKSEHRDSQFWKWDPRIVVQGLNEPVIGCPSFYGVPWDFQAKRPILSPEQIRIH